MYKVTSFQLSFSLLKRRHSIIFEELPLYITEENGTAEDREKKTCASGKIPVSGIPTTPWPHRGSEGSGAGPTETTRITSKHLPGSGGKAPASVPPSRVWMEAGGCAVVPRGDQIRTEFRNYIRSSRWAITASLSATSASSTNYTVLRQFP